MLDAVDDGLMELSGVARRVATNDDPTPSDLSGRSSDEHDDQCRVPLRFTGEQDDEAIVRVFEPSSRKQRFITLEDSDRVGCFVRVKPD